MILRWTAWSLLVFALISWGCAGGGRAVTVPVEGTPVELSTAFALAGANAPELQRFLERYPLGAPEREAATYVLAGLPAADALRLSADVLSENLELAMQTRRETAWGPSIPWSDFLRYVLPHRITQEPAQPWRPVLHRRLAGVAREAGSLHAAVEMVFSWCASAAAYTPTAPDDQGVLDTLARGAGRCEEQAGVCIAGLRSVGIPARYALTPAWKAWDGNHAWVEVWTPDGWMPLGPFSDLRPGAAPVVPKNMRNAAFVVSPGYGPAGEPDGPIFRRTPRYTLQNLTSAYGPTGTLEVEVLAPDGLPLAHPDVYVSVCNGSLFRPLARFRGGPGGRVQAGLAEGAVLVTSARDGRLAGTVALVRPGETARVTLQLGQGLPRLDGAHMDGGAFRDGPSQQGTGRPAELVAGANRRWRDAAEAAGEWLEPLLGMLFSRLGFGQATGQTDQAANAETAVQDVARRLANAGPARSGVVEALFRVDPEQLGTALALLRTQTPKDMARCEPTAFLDHLETAAASRALARERWGLKYDDGVFAQFVLPQRVTPFVNWEGGRDDLARRFGRLHELEFSEAVAEVRGMLGELGDAPPTPFGPLPEPLDVWSARGDVPEGGRRWAAVALLRALGIPARELVNWDMVEYLDGERWRPLGRDRTDGRLYGAPAELRVVLTRDGEPVPAVYGENCGVSILPGLSPDPAVRRVDGVDLSYCRRLWPGPYVLGERGAEGAAVFRLPAGDYAVSASRRGDDRWPVAWLRTVRLASGERRTVAFDLGVTDGE